MQYSQPYDQTSNPDASYVNGNPSSGIQGSIIPAGAVENPQREIIALIQAAGITPNNSDLSQAAKAIQSGKLNYAIAGGSANALTATLMPVPAAYGAGMGVLLKITTTNTDAAFLNLNGLGAVAITRADLSAAQPGDLRAGSLVWLEHDGTQFQISGLVSSNLPSTTTQSFATSTTWTPPAGVTKIKRARVWGAGGGGGGANANIGAAGAGGSGGGYAEGINYNVTPGTPITVTIGVGGSGGNSSPTAGVSGGASSLGALISATGGGGGGGGNNAIQPIGSTGGVGSNGNVLNLNGQPGGTGYSISGGSLSGLGGGTFGAPSSGPNVGTGGSAGASPGGGGAGASGTSISGAAGGNGGGGLIIIEY